MDKNNEIQGGVCRGIDRESFAPVAGVLCAIAAGVVDFVIRVFRLTTIGSDHYTAGMDGLYLAIGILGLLSCIYFAVGIMLVRAKIFPAPLTATLAAPLAVTFLLQMIFGCLKNGQYTMTVEILFFAFMLVGAVAVLFLVIGRISRRKAIILMIGICAIAFICSFLPALLSIGTPEKALSLVEDGFSIYLPMTVMLAAVMCLAFGVEEQKDN